jgi:hydroxyacylglutathione hydrolase
MACRVLPVPCLADNYAYLVICEATGEAAVIDPGQAPPVLAAAAAAGVRVAAIWATHHHPDHVGGVPGLVEALGAMPVVAHRTDLARVPHATVGVDDGDAVGVGRLRATALHNPGHTLSACSYLVDGAPGDLFTGDTLFGAGCGRLFEGTADQLRRSLARLAALPPDTRAWFGHEYTVANLRFAAAVEPASPAVAARAEAAAARRARGEPTTPSTIALERATNPFLRVGEPEVVAAARRHAPAVDAADPTSVFAALRAWKDGFR